MARYLYGLSGSRRYNPGIPDGESESVSLVEEIESSLKGLGQPPQEIAGEMTGKDKTSFFATKDKGLQGMEFFRQIMEEVKSSTIWKESELPESEKEEIMIAQVAAWIARHASAGKQKGVSK